MPNTRKLGLPAPVAKPTPVRWMDLTLLKQVPKGHIIGTARMALLSSPCCLRQIRVHLIYVDKHWTHTKVQRCPYCRRLWRLNLQLSTSGFVLKARLKLVGKYSPKK